MEDAITSVEAEFEFSPIDAVLEPLDPRALLTWVGRGTSNPSLLAWPVVLLPDFVAGRGTMPQDSVGLYHSVEWRAPIPDRPFDATVRPTWSASRDGRREYELCTEAMVDGRVLGRSKIVCYTGARVADLGQPRLPLPPETAEMTVARHITISEDDVKQFCEEAGTHYLVTSRVGRAQELGFRNILVPSQLITVTHLVTWPQLPPAGSIEVWYRGPVTAGSAMTMCRLGQDPHSWGLRGVGSSRPATVSRGRACSADDGIAPL